MIGLRVDGKAIEVEAGGTVLDAARAAGARVPTMCHDPGCEPSASCRVCMVRDVRRNALIASCSAPAENGMDIETGSPAVREARRTAVELLLSEHVGDCEGPCRRGCPVGMDAPRLIRQIAAGDFPGAAATARLSIALPRTIARLCHAPCEKTCRRAQHDEGIAIRLLERLAAEAGAAEAMPASRGRAAVVGAGPAGLAAAHELRRRGVACTVLHAGHEPGGTLRAVAPADLPPAALAADLADLRRLGVEFRGGVAVADADQAARLRQDYDAVILAPGEAGRSWVAALGLQAPERAEGAVLSDGDTLFACGNAVRPRRQVILAMADGRAAARLAAKRLGAAPPAGEREWSFDSRMGRLKEGEMAQFLCGADPGKRTVPRAVEAGFDGAEARREAGRCLRCDCRKAGACRLRECAEELGASQAAFRGTDRQAFERLAQHAEVVYEPGKCIRCGLCIQITARGGERYGFTFVGRGFDVRVAVPFGESLAAGLRQTAAACIGACPTGALA
jgi:ferredoxin